MLVKIDGVIYNSNNILIMVCLDEEDKKSVSGMDKSLTIFSQAPDGMSEGPWINQLDKFKEESISRGYPE